MAHVTLDLKTMHRLEVVYLLAGHQAILLVLGRPVLRRL